MTKLKTFKIFVLFIGILLIFGCNKTFREQVSVYCEFNRQNIFSKENSKEHYREIDFVQTNIIYKLDDTITEEKYLKLRFPEKIDRFTLADSSACNFSYTKYSQSGKPSKMQIRGLINCFELDSAFWYVHIETDGIKYKGIISINEKPSNLFIATFQKKKF